jgi:putative transcriptional regulator
LEDQVFGKSIVYICEHDKNGAMGFLINKPFPEKNLKLILQETGLSKLEPHPNIYLGGPVGINNGFFIHTSKYYTEGTQKISKTISITSNLNVIDDLANGLGPNKYRFSLGYAGWDKGQLDQEIENGDWFIMPATSKLIFNTPDSKKWDTVSSEFGIDLVEITGNTGFA